MSVSRRALLPAAGLLVVWLILSRSVSPGYVLAGVAVASLSMLVVPPGEGPALRLSALPRLVRDEAVAVARATVAVLRTTFSRRRPTPGMIDVELPDGRPRELSWLAAMLTLTPGTYVVDMDVERHVLRVHVLDASDLLSLMDDVRRIDRDVRALFGIDRPHVVSAQLVEHQP